jgi:hypothetical protein
MTDLPSKYPAHPQVDGVVERFWRLGSIPFHDDAIDLCKQSGAHSNIVASVNDIRRQLRDLNDQSRKCLG